MTILGLTVAATNIARAEAHDRPSVVAHEAAGMAAGWAGADLGAAAGSAILPGVGTVLGAFLGGVVGAVLAERVVANQPRGGVMLSGEADVLGQIKFDIDSIDSAFVDMSGKLVILSSSRTEVPGMFAITDEDFLICLAIAYADLDISFSLDPWDPLKPDGPHYQKVFYPNLLEGTRLGQTLFGTDYLMKKLAFGLCPGPRNFCNHMQLILRSSRNERKSRHRLWIISQNMPLSVVRTETGQSLQFGTAKKRYCCRKLVVDATSPSGLTDAIKREDMGSPSQQFARQFTDRYDDIAKQYPVFERLRNLSKLFALAKFLRDHNVKIDTARLFRSLRNHGVTLDANAFVSTGLVRTHLGHERPVDRLTGRQQ